MVLPVRLSPRWWKRRRAVTASSFAPSTSICKSLTMIAKTPPGLNATPHGKRNAAAVPSPSAKPLLLTPTVPDVFPARVVTRPVDKWMWRTRWLEKSVYRAGVGWCGVGYGGGGGGLGRGWSEGLHASQCPRKLRINSGCIPTPPPRVALSQERRTLLQSQSRCQQVDRTKQSYHIRLYSRNYLCRQCQKCYQQW